MWQPCRTFWDIALSRISFHNQFKYKERNQNCVIIQRFMKTPHGQFMQRYSFQEILNWLNCSISFRVACYLLYSIQWCVCWKIRYTLYWKMMHEFSMENEWCMYIQHCNNNMAVGVGDELIKMFRLFLNYIFFWCQLRVKFICFFYCMHLAPSSQDISVTIVSPSRGSLWSSWHDHCIVTAIRDMININPPPPPLTFYMNSHNCHCKHRQINSFTSADSTFAWWKMTKNRFSQPKAVIKHDYKRCSV